MADTVTANYGLVKPEISGSNDTWGNKLNNNLDELDTLIKSMDDGKIGPASLTAAAEKPTPVDADEFWLTDSAAAFASKSITWGSVKAAILAYLLQFLNHSGDIKATTRKVPVTGWLICNGNTIGNAASGATARANADCVSLFGVLWENTNNAELPIQNSSGVATTRGATAAEDFAANKRLPLPDMRGRVLAGWDSGGTAGRLTSTTVNSANMAASGGAQTHTLATTELPSHTHGMTHGHADNFSIPEGGSHLHDLYLDGVGPGSGILDDTSGRSAAPSTGFIFNGAHTHAINGNVTDFSGNTASTGSGAAHNNVQPTFVINYMIKL